ncbi:MAG: DNA-binding protein WhiA, partial [Bifidobacterium crudilactis]|nr:DNA-binding protein WhiA [Bifidobacterium crudilactis]
MALLDDVKSELAAIDNELPAAKKAQAATMIRFGGGLHLLQRHIVVEAQFDSLDSAQWLQNTIKEIYGHSSDLIEVARQTPTGNNVRYSVRVLRAGGALALQTGLLDRRKRPVRGLPADIISGNIA